jgi:RNA-directed DNA polymerase
VKRFKQSLRTALHAGNHAPLDEVVADVNRKLRGWAQHFSVGTLEPAYRSVDRYTSDLLRKFLVRRHKVPGRGTRRFREQYLYETLHLVCLQDRRRVLRSHAVA